MILIMAGQSQTFSYVWIYSVLIASGTDLRRRSQGPSSRLKFVALFMMIKKLMDSILVIVSNSDC